MQNRNSRITLFLMSRKGLKVLETLGANFSGLIDFIVTERDASVQEDCYSEIRQTCKRFGIRCFDRKDIYIVTSRYALAVSWRWIIKLDKTELIVFHDSLLPKYRGFNPLVSYLINGEPEIGVTALFAADDYDVGDIICKSASRVSYPLKIAEAIETIAGNYAELAEQIIEKIAAGDKLATDRQNETEASYSLWRDEEDYKIDWNLSAKEIRRFIDAVGFPYKGALTTINNKPARVLEAEEIDDVKIENRQPGKIIFIKNNSPFVVCGQGLLKILKLIDDVSGENLLPLKRFRLRFK